MKQRKTKFPPQLEPTHFALDPSILKSVAYTQHREISKIGCVMDSFIRYVLGIGRIFTWIHDSKTRKAPVKGSNNGHVEAGEATCVLAPLLDQCSVSLVSEREHMFTNCY
jgi:hypothetical protein